MIKNLQRSIIILSIILGFNTSLSAQGVTSVSVPPGIHYVGSTIPVTIEYTTRTGEGLQDKIAIAVQVTQVEGEAPVWIFAQKPQVTQGTTSITVNITIPTDAGAITGPAFFNAKMQPVEGGATIGSQVNYEYTLSDIALDVAKKETVDFTVSPNPASEYLTIATPEGATIEVINSTGATLKKLDKASASTTLSISDLSPGIYFVKVSSSGAISIKKVLVQ